MVISCKGNSENSIFALLHENFQLFEKYENHKIFL